MSMWMLQRQMTETAGPFRRILACGSAPEMARLLNQAQPVVSGPDGAIRLLEVSGTQAERRALDRLVGSLRSRGWQVRREAAAGLESDAILDAVERERHELLLKAVSRTPDERRMMPDAVDQALIDRCPCPVWLGDAALDRPPRRLAAAIEPVRGDPVTRELSRAVMEMAGTLAAATGSDLRVLSAVVPFGAHLLRRRAAPEDVRVYMAHAEETARRALDEVLASAPPGTPAIERRHVVCGEMSIQLPRLIREARIELVVIGTRGRRSRIAGRLMTPHARQLLERSACSMLVIKR